MEHNTLCVAQCIFCDSNMWLGVDYLYLFYRGVSLIISMFAGNITFALPTRVLTMLVVSYYPLNTA